MSVCVCMSQCKCIHSREQENSSLHVDEIKFTSLSISAPCSLLFNSHRHGNTCMTSRSANTHNSFPINSQESICACETETLAETLLHCLHSLGRCCGGKPDQVHASAENLPTFLARAVYIPSSHDHMFSQMQPFVWLG